MDAHINATCKRAFWEICDIRRIRSFLDEMAASSLVHSFVCAKIDSLLYGLPTKQLDKLQCVLNCAAWGVAKVKRNDHIIPNLLSLHWFPISNTRGLSSKFY